MARFQLVDIGPYLSILLSAARNERTLALVGRRTTTASLWPPFGRQPGFIIHTRWLGLQDFDDCSAVHSMKRSTVFLLCWNTIFLNCIFCVVAVFS